MERPSNTTEKSAPPAGRLPRSETAPQVEHILPEDPTERLTLAEQTVAQDRMEAAAAAQPDRELMTINFGPHHPSTHGVLRILATLEAEGDFNRMVAEM